MIPTYILFFNSDASFLQVFHPTNFARVRTLGQAMLKYPEGLCIDAQGRVYVANHSAKTVVVLDGATGAKLAEIAINGNPRGVAVANNGAILVSHYSPNGLALIESE